jgi:hypothetical protein
VVVVAAAGGRWRRHHSLARASVLAHRRLLQSSASRAGVESDSRDDGASSAQPRTHARTHARTRSRFGSTFRRTAAAGGEGAAAPLSRSAGARGRERKDAAHIPRRTRRDVSAPSSPISSATGATLCARAPAPRSVHALLAVRVCGPEGRVPAPRRLRRRGAAGTGERGRGRGRFRHADAELRLPRESRARYARTGLGTFRGPRVSPP